MRGAVSQVESLLTLRAVEVGPLEAPHALKGAAVAPHGVVGHVDKLEVIIIWAVAGVVGHIGHIAIHARNDAGIVKQIGLVPAGRVAARAVAEVEALEAVLLAINTVAHVLGDVLAGDLRAGDGVVSDLVHGAVFVGALGAFGVALLVGVVEDVGRLAGVAGGQRGAVFAVVRALRDEN